MEQSQDAVKTREGPRPRDSAPAPGPGSAIADTASSCGSKLPSVRPCDHEEHVLAATHPSRERRIANVVFVAAVELQK